MPKIIDSLNMLDPLLVAELIEAAQLALNDSRTVKRVASEMHVEPERIMSLGLLAIQLSTCPGSQPDITSMAELDEHQAELAKQVEG